MEGNSSKHSAFIYMTGYRLFSFVKLKKLKLHIKSEVFDEIDHYQDWTKVRMRWELHFAREYACSFTMCKNTILSLLSRGITKRN